MRGARGEGGEGWAQEGAQMAAALSSAPDHCGALALGGKGDLGAPRGQAAGGELGTESQAPSLWGRSGARRDGGGWSEEPVRQTGRTRLQESTGGTGCSSVRALGPFRAQSTLGPANRPGRPGGGRDAPILCCPSGQLRLPHRTSQVGCLQPGLSFSPSWSPRPRGWVVGSGELSLSAD